ncbi:hypothetical protein [Tateyamaria sp. SN6-1]|uniref:hypothetical protein n=1 Tax=Tateyamaria sp. SN6-1 TaxID=3092148 RepID=UPI0039F44798
MGTVEQLNKTESGFAEVLTTQATGEVYGHRLRGAAPGPQLVVAGMCASAEIVFDRLLQIPTLPWMKGNLLLIQLNKLDNLQFDLATLPPLGIIDRTLVLPWDSSDETDVIAARRNYHLVLRTCAELGMIQGRGVASARSEEG